MPGRRADGQTLVSFPLKEDFLQKLEDARGHTNRSEFVRQAIREKLLRMGVAVPEGDVASPDRAGKGGRPSKAAELKVADEGGGEAEEPQRNKVNYRKAMKKQTKKRS